ncbi:MAG: putative 4-deoxy-4-formamido-L-arabinose-phosphoundecaprenol deformylase ArnD [Synergistetes bacterium ADurb.Bin155]|jgi:peptidoglycan/xylan/chitin deacetylase (PgdA/CDA1 family)|nr:4-deoxy-4-formamido-L-arabinose-phosphoundecaprenol deformylase [Synergistales bacterium]MBP8995353.1 4-deoxy-4-formamido-L-arabinose-phosphoundecaprenol deformylase [Synergistales bacterium]NMD17296.1 4-deoxy-4-formamido-L-arabinose-phosphoundecaprenol deformylase [Synergistaceae bacterium]OQB45909.1 MAG: putative 4-deoxy-4-formamido-L-arabinose-phosphoundecaprenol deformylase ArnD [Synergistetes bacterium ADurb.Bin155]
MEAGNTRGRTRLVKGGVTVERKTLAIKVDVDTLKGYLEGVPRLLDILGRRDLRASFFFSFGPDNSGRALRRVFRKGFIGKMLRTDAPGTYGLKTMLYGTLLPAPLIVPRDPGIFRRVLSEGHEGGIHAWDHVTWQDKLDRMPKAMIREHFDRAFEMFRDLSGREPRCCAAPAWKATASSLAMQDRYGFDYCSDTRGVSPFIPRMEGRVFITPQVPTTLPTMDELLGRSGIDGSNLNSHLLGLMGTGLNVHTVHAEMEGGSRSGLFEELLDRCLELGVGITSTGEALRRLEKGSLPVMDVVQRAIPGRAGKVSVQA